MSTVFWKSHINMTWSKGPMHALVMYEMTPYLKHGIQYEPGPMAWKFLRINSTLHGMEFVFLVETDIKFPRRNDVLLEPLRCPEKLRKMESFSGSMPGGVPVKAPYRWILRNSCDLLFMLIYTDTHFACTLIVYIICICTCTLTGARHCIEPICSMGLEYLPTNLLASGEYTIYGTHLPTKTARLPFTQVHFTCSSGYWGRPVALCHDGGNLGRKFAPLSFHILQS